MTPIEIVLTLWRYGHMTEAEVTEWAWNQVALAIAPGEDLMELATDGPTRCRACLEFCVRGIA
jgi:hypothetical protein